MSSENFGSASQNEINARIARAIDARTIEEMDESSVKGTSTRALRVYKKILVDMGASRTERHAMVEEWIDDAIDIVDAGGSRVADWK